jgi:SAM-dependent methyltransferase
MTQNIYDDPGFFAGYSRLPRSVQGLDGAGEWPAMRALLPDLGGLRVVGLAAQSFDLAYSSLALHYVEDLAGLFATVHRALVPGGRLVFSVEHPILTAPTHPQWSLDPAGRRTWPIDRYLVEGPRTTDWIAAGVIKQHRTVATTLNHLLRPGFTLSHVEEWGPTDVQIAAQPDWAEARDRPMFLLVAARR